MLKDEDRIFKNLYTMILVGKLNLLLSVEIGLKQKILFLKEKNLLLKKLKIQNYVEEVELVFLPD